MLTDRESDISLFTVMLSVVLPHDALEFGEFAHHQGAEVSLCEVSRAGSILGARVKTDGDEACHRADTVSSFKLAAELRVVHHILQAGNAAFQRFLLVGFIEELGVSQTGADDAGVAGADFLAAVSRNELRDEQELVHEATGSVAEREVLLIQLHRENQALFRNREVFLFEFGSVHHRPLGERGDFIEQRLRHDGRAAEFGSLVVEELADQSAAVSVGDHDTGVLQLLRIGIRAVDRHFAGRHKAVAAGHASGLETEERHWHHVFTVKCREITDRADKLNRRFAVGELVAHHARDRELLGGVFNGSLKAFRKRDAGLRVFNVEEVLAAFSLRDELGVSAKAESLKLLQKGSRGLAFCVKADRLRHQLFGERFVGGVVKHVRDVNREAAGSAVAGGNRTGFRQVLGREALRDFISEGLGKRIKGFRRQLFRLEFN